MLGIAGLGIVVLWLIKPSTAGWNDNDQAQIDFPRGTVIAEVASSSIKRYRGLSGRPPLAKDTGMLFVFGRADTYPFVMRGMTFPLDFIWINENRVVAINQNIPSPTSGQEPQMIIPSAPASMVLETPAGTIDGLKIAPGDHIAITKKKTE